MDRFKLELGGSLLFTLLILFGIYERSVVYMVQYDPIRMLQHISVDFKQPQQNRVFADSSPLVFHKIWHKLVHIVS